MKWSDMKRKWKENEMKWTENEMKWNEMKWNETNMEWKRTLSEMKCGVMTLRKKKNDHDQVNQNQNGNQNQKVSDSLAHTRLTQWGGAREKKGRIYQPHPLLNFSIGTQPLLDFLRLTITLQLWGWGGAREEKVQVSQTDTAQQVSTSES